MDERQPPVRADRHSKLVLTKSSCPKGSQAISRQCAAPAGYLRLMAENRSTVSISTASIEKLVQKCRKDEPSQASRALGVKIHAFLTKRQAAFAVSTMDLRSKLSTLPYLPQFALPQATFLGHCDRDAKSGLPQGLH